MLDENQPLSSSDHIEVMHNSIYEGLTGPVTERTNHCPCLRVPVEKAGDIAHTDKLVM